MRGKIFGIYPRRPTPTHIPTAPSGAATGRRPSLGIAAVALLLEYTQGCHSFARRDRGEGGGANEHALLRCREQFDVSAVNIDSAGQELPLFDWLAELRQCEEQTTAFGADAEEIPQHVICLGRDACSVDHA